MNAEWLRTRGIVATAVGAGLLLGAAGVLIYQQLMAEKRRLDRIASSVSLLRRELDHLKRCHAAIYPNCTVCMQALFNINDIHPPVNGKQSSRSLSDFDMYSTVSRLDEEDGDSEFFDLSDDDEGSLNNRDGSSRVSLAGDYEEFIELLNQVDRLLAEGTADDKSFAYTLLLGNKNKYQGNVSFLWRLARACHAMSSVVAQDKKKESLFQGLEFAKSALAMDNQNADAHKWYAITLGSCGDFLPLKEKISNGYVFKQHVDKAIALRPSDYSLYHLLGRFEYEVASLSWLERKLASSLFAAPPEGSYQIAFSQFSKAEQLSTKEWKENRLFLAKCCAQLGQMKDCIQWLDKAAAAPTVSPEDFEAESELQQLIPKYESYRS